MTIYADTSWWLAYKCRRDIHHVSAVGLFDSLDDPLVLWTPWQRVEVLNAFYQAERGALIARGEAAKMIRLLEDEIRLGYWPHYEFDWINAVQIAKTLSSRFSLAMTVRSMDLFHVAIAIECGVDFFATFDADQENLAKAHGLEVLPLR